MTAVRRTALLVVVALATPVGLLSDPTAVASPTPSPSPTAASSSSTPSPAPDASPAAPTASPSASAAPKPAEAAVRPRAAAAAPQPRLSVTQTVDPASFDHAGQVLTWTSVVTNTGNTSLSSLGVSDASTLVSARTCAPVPAGGALAAGGSTTCTATSTIRQDFLDEDATRTDAVTATATTSQGGTTYRTSASATASSTVLASPGLSLTATISPAIVARPGQRVAYTLVVRNRGNQTLSDLVASAPVAGLSALVCSPVELGSALAPGTSTTCRASRTTTPADLGTSVGAGTVKATARTKTRAVGATGTVQVANDAKPPVATDDSVSVVDGGGPVVLEGSHNDRPGEPGGAEIDPSRTVLVGKGVATGGQYLSANTLEWSVGPDGRVRVELLTPGQHSLSGSVDYRVYDLAGRSDTGRLTVTVLRKAASTDDAALTKQAIPVTTDVLGNDDPGEGPGGTRATLDPGSVRIVGVPFDGPQFPSPSADGRKLSIPYVGTYDVTDAGGVRFSPRATFSGSSKAIYTATSSNGSTVTGTLRATVLAVTPTAHDEKLTTRYGRGVTFPAASDDKAGGPSAPLAPATTVLLAPGVDPGGKTYTTRAGTWSVQPDGSVRMVPAVGYSGTSAVSYRTADSNGTRVSASLTLTVRRGPRSVPLTASTAAGRSVTLTPLTADTPGQRTDGTTATFDPASLVLLTTGLPTGSAVTDGGRTLTVPGQGVWTVDAAVGSVTFDSAGSFSGAATTVTYQVRDDGGSTVAGRLTVAVVASGPVATDDVAGTPAAAAVVLPGATNDSAGAAPLNPGRTVFPADGQPAGSTRATDGKTLTVPGQGTWTLGSDGAATFAPDPAFVGTTAAVAYRISDLTGATARASLRVVVQAGPSARPDAVRIGFRGGDVVTVPVLDNDVPGRNADGSLGSTDRTTLLFPATGQADGWSIEQAGTLAYLGPLGQEVFAYVDHANGTISVNRGSVRTPMTLALRYTVSDVVRTADGAVVHRATTGTLQIEVPVTAPIAVDDVASTPSPLPVELPALANDVPGDLSVPIRTTVSSLTFPTDQVLPPGSVINNNPYPNATVTVPGQGVWLRLSHSQEVYFTPDPAFVGDATVRYLVSDNEGWTAEGTLRVTVLRGASAHDDTATTEQGVPTTVDLLANDDAGLNTDRTLAVWDTGAFSFPAGGQPSGSSSNFGQRQLVVPGQGRYTLQRSGAVVFEPAPDFAGTTTPVTVALQALVQADSPQERFLSTTLTVTIAPVTPTATDDRATTAPGHPVVVRVLDNDRAGLPEVPLDTSSVRLRLPADAPAGSTLYGDAKTLVLPGHGTFLVAGDGEVTFVPLGSRTGSLTVGYQAADANGTTTRANLSVTVG